MIINKDGNISLITQERGGLKEFAKQFLEKYPAIKQDHLIISLTTLTKFSVNDILEFLEISNLHRGEEKSFVLVTDKVDFDAIPDEMVVVPSIQEAYDIIEMEDIERDLGF